VDSTPSTQPKSTTALDGRELPTEEEEMLDQLSPDELENSPSLAYPDERSLTKGYDLFALSLKNPVTGIRALLC
jgi:hypothetical protein